MNKEKERLQSYLTGLRTYAKAILSGTIALDEAIENGVLDEEECNIIRGLFSSYTAKTNMSDVNLAFMQIMEIVNRKTP